MKWQKILLIIILSLAALLRLWDIGEVPAGFNADEASLGYNAYSILKTGKDEYGAWFPLTFKSFGDYKPGLYVYLAMPFVATLGLDEFAVRLPSIILGIATVWLIYLIGKKVFRSEVVGLAASFVLATSPWHIHFSRGAWETNVATFFISLGFWLFIKGLEQNKWLLWSGIAFLAAMYTYQSPRLTVPVMLIIFFLIYHQKIIVAIKQRLKSLLVLCILIIPLVFQILNGTGESRFAGLSFISDKGPILRSNELRGEHEDSHGLFAQLMHNKVTTYTVSFLTHYFDHFSGEFLFVNGDPLIRNKVPETGQFYMIEGLFLAVGMLSLIKKRLEYMPGVYVWLLIAPLASALTYETPSALRALAMVIPLSLIIGYGFIQSLLIIYQNLAKPVTVLLIIFITVCFCFELIHYEESYFIHYPQRYPLAWEYGFKQMVQKLNQYENQYQKIVITDTYDQPYILLLFYKKYDPSKYQPQAILSERDKFNFGTVKQFDKYQFRMISPSEVMITSNTLFIGTPKEIPPEAKVIDQVLLPDGTPGFIFAHR